MAEIIDKYSEDNTFWRFVDDFAATVDLDLKQGRIERVCNLLIESVRRYEWLREFEPGHFKRLKESDPAKMKTLVAIVDWVIMENLPVSHYSRAGAGASGELSAFASLLSPRRLIAQASQNPAVAVDVSAAVFSELEDEPRQPEVPQFQEGAVQIVADPTQPETMNEAALKALAVSAYETALGKVVKVRTYAIHDWINPKDGYALAVVKETPPSEIGILEAHDGDEISMRSTWSVKMLTGEHRGETGFVHAPAFHSDGYFNPQWVFTDNSLNKDYKTTWLSEQDLVELARRDCMDLEGKTITISAGEAYIGDTEMQELFSFDPPILATVDPFDFAQFASKYRIDNGNGRENLVIDVYLDLDSDDHQAANLRSLWCHGTSYYQDGTIEPAHSILAVLDPAAHTGPQIQI